MLTLRVLLTATAVCLLLPDMGFAQTPLPSAAASPPSGEQPGSRAAYSTSQLVELRSPLKRASVDVEVPGTRAIYDAIARAFQITLNYDASVTETRVVAPFHMRDATLEETLTAAGSITRSFVVPLNQRLGLILADTPENHAAMERTVLSYMPLDPQTTIEQITEVITTLRNMVDLRRVIPDMKSRTLAVMGRARQVKLAERFLDAFSHPPGEVLLEVHLWELNSDRARAIGLTPARPFDLIFLPGIPQPAPATSTSGTLAAAATTAVSKLPRLGAFGTLQTLYGLNFPSLQLVLNSSNSLVHSRRVARVRAMKGQKVTLLDGVRYPVLNSTYAANQVLDPNQPAGSGLYPDVQYQDIGTNLTATPYFHAGGEITLQFDLATKAIASLNEIGMPTISNRQTTSQVRLRDGETYLLGGVMQATDSRSVSGYPILSQIPLFGRLFGVRNTTRHENEFIMAIRPIIMRPDPAELIASRALFFGREVTGLPNVPEYAPPAQTQPGAPPAPGQPAQPGAQPGTQPGQPTIPGQQPVQPLQPLQPGQIFQTQPVAPNQPGLPGQPGVQQPSNQPGFTPIGPFGQPIQQQPGTQQPGNQAQPFSPFAQPQQPQQPVSPPIPGAPFQQQSEPAAN